MTTAAIGAILSSLASLAAYFAVPAISNSVADFRNSKKKVTELDIANLVSNLYNSVSNKGSKAIVELNNRLNSLPIMSTSGVVKDMIQRKRRELTKSISNVEQSMNDVATQAQGIERRANAFSMMSNSYKRSDQGQKDFKRIEEDAKNLMIKAKDIEKPIIGDNNEKIQK